MKLFIIVNEKGQYSTHPFYAHLEGDWTYSYEQAEVFASRVAAKQQAGYINGQVRAIIEEKAA